MEFCPPCAICCTICSLEKPKTPIKHAFGEPTPQIEQPFALNNLLAAGTVAMKRVPQAEPSLCDHIHTDDGWHEFRGVWHSGYLGKDDAELALRLQFLVRHDFIRTTYNITDEETLTLRIYIIPADLKNVKGRLHHNNREYSVCRSGRQYLRELLPMIIQDNDQWYGCSSKTVSSSAGLIYAPLDGRTLAEIYSDLASPRVDPTAIDSEIVRRLLNYDDDLEGLGLRSVLYKYQRRSVAAMVTRELDLRTIPDPLYLAISTINGRPFCLQPGTMEFLQERGMVAPTPGGILCEELGTGKTVMVLSLILSTLYHLPSPPETTSGIPVVLTPLALKTFPSGPYVAARNDILKDSENVIENGSRLPSLVELLLHNARTTSPTELSDPNVPGERHRYEQRLKVQSQLDVTPLKALLKANVPFYVATSSETNESWDFRRGRDGTSPRIMYLSAATLIVVPPNLLGQWDREISKHCKHPLRVFMWRTGIKLPSARTLANDFDIILIAYNRFRGESSRKDVSSLYGLPPCTCQNLPASRVPECKCPEPSGVSPFLRIRWKRLVIDEGHVASNLSTDLVPFTKLLSVERRWIVTGTPTTNLLGLSLGQNNISEFTPYTSDGDRSDVSEDDPSNSDRDITPSRSRLRVWNKYDREDLKKLDNMITHFVAVPHFIANSGLMSTHVRDPLLDEKGPVAGSIQVLNQVMEMVMIRHRIEEIEKDISLPPVVLESILLDLDPIVAKSYNALQATIAINAIDSQRTDQDYLFHPRNTEYLQLTVKNMSQLMFWHVDETLYYADQLMENAHKTIEHAVKRNMPQEDIQLIQEAFRHIQSAAVDPLWRQIQTHEDIPYRTCNLPKKIFDAWTRTPEVNENNSYNAVGLVHADRLLKLQGLVTSQPLMDEVRLVEEGIEVVQTDKKLREEFEETYKRKHNKKYIQGSPKTITGMPSEAGDVHAGFMVENAAKKAAAFDTLKAMRKELGLSLAKLKRDDEDESSNSTGTLDRGVGSEARTSGDAPSVLLRRSVLTNVVVSSSASSKLNYIINEVMKYSTDEKFLIFSDSELTLAHIAEALELIQIKFLRFTTQIQPQVREQLVLTFETSETYRVFLMELKHGARGLNLISASRVIFCEPVWQADVESQAIKRAHRIGQTRSITVKTLAIRGTAEENMVERRNVLKGSHDKVPKLIEESGMRHFIANPKFLTHVPEKLPQIQFPLLHFPRSTPQPSPGPRSPSVPSLSQRSVSFSTQNPISVEDSLTEQGFDVIECSPPKKKMKAAHLG